MTIIGGGIYIIHINKQSKNVESYSESEKTEIPLNEKLADVNSFNEQFISYEGTTLTAIQTKEI